jgi:hypothetical protein
VISGIKCTATGMPSITRRHRNSTNSTVIPEIIQFRKNMPRFIKNNTISIVAKETSRLILLLEYAKKALINVNIATIKQSAEAKRK